jgi:hypothetical protein
MADEDQNLEQVTQETQEEVKLSPVEQKAAEQGWVPKEQWEGPEEQWRDAQTFIDRGELFKKIEDQNRTVKELRKVIDDLKKHNQRIEKVEYQRALEALKAQKKEALVEGDADAVVEIDEKMAVVREAQRTAEAAPAPAQQAAELNPVFVAWKERNSWYDSSRPMRAFADQLGIELGSKGMSPSDILHEVERQVKAEFAEKFQNPRRSTPGAVETSTNKNSGKTKDSFQLSEDERRVMQRFVRQGAISEEDYIKQLKQAKQRGV